MKQTIEIEVPDGKKAVWKDGKVVFEDIKHDPPRFPKTWKEFCEFYPIPRGSACIDRDSNLLFRWKDRRCDLFDRNVLPSEKAAKAHRALMQLHQLRDVWREGWVPDWTEDNQKKYVICSLDGKFSIKIRYTNRYFLAFQDEKRAYEFKDCFIDLIRNAGDLI